MPIDESLARQQWERYAYMRDTGHLAYVEKAIKCDNLFCGDHWDPADKAALRESRRPGLTINKTLGTLSSIMGEQIDLRAEIAYRARHGAPKGNADALTDTFQFIGQQNQLAYLRSELFADGSITSRGYLDVRMNYDRSVTGDVQIQNLNPKNVLPDPDASQYDPDTWNDIIVTKWMTADDIEYMYNKKDAAELREKAASSWAYGYDSIDRMRDRFAGSGPIGLYITEDLKNVAKTIRVIERQYRKLDKMKYFINTKTGDRKEVPLSWDDNKIAALLQYMQGLIVVDEHVGHRIRWTVTADNYVLHDEWSPYKHFTVIPYFPYFRYGKTIGLVENLIDPQELLNKSTSGELHAITTMANSGYILRRGALVNMTVDELEEIGAKSGIVIEVENNADTDIKKIQPNQIPQGLSDLSRKGESFIKTVSMRGDAQTGMARADVSADQIDVQKANADIGLVKPLDNLARSDFILARNVRDLIQEFYTDPRIMTITHNAVSQETRDVSINWPDPATGEVMNDLTMGEYDITVVGIKKSVEESTFEQAAQMREKLGIKIPDSFMIEASSIPNKTSLLKAMEEEAQSETAQLQQKIAMLSQQLAVAEQKAKTGDLEASAVLKRSKAAHAIAQTQEIAGADPSKDAEIQLEQQKHEQEMQQNQEQHDQDLQHEKEKHALEQQAKAQQADDDRRLKRAQAIQAMRQSAQQPK